MARIRTIKPEFWTSAQVLECSTNARLLFIGLWNFADDAGRHPDSAKQVKAEVFPSDDITLAEVQSLLDELAVIGLIRRYTAENTGYFLITGWHHQRIDKPQPPKYPGPIAEHSKNDTGTLPPYTIRNDTKGKDIHVAPEGAVSEVFTYWQTVHDHPRAKLDAKRKRNITARLKDGYTVADLKRAVDGCKTSPYHQGQNDTGTVYDDIELICRDGKHVDQFLKQKPSRGLGRIE